MVNQRGSLTNEQVVELVSHRYTLNNANNYLTALAELGLVYRQVAPRVTGGYAAQAHALTVPEEEMNYATRLV